MKLKKTLLAVLAGSAAAVALPAFADNGWHGGWRHHQHRHYYAPAPRVVYVPAPRVYYAPPPAVVYAPPPRVVYPAPVYSAPAPVYVQPGVSIRFNLPL